MSYDKIVDLFKTILNTNISEGTIENMLEKLSNDLTDKTTDILDNLKKSNVIGSDETSIRINGKNFYLWVF